MPIETLPGEVRVEDAVEMACAQDVTFIEERLRRGMSVLVECDKELALHVYLAVRARLRRGTGNGRGPQIVIVDGRPREGEESRGNLASMLTQLTTAIRGSVERTIIVLLHLDVLTTTHTSLTMEAREAIPLLYENPEAVLLGFRDPSFPLPKVIEGVFAVRREIVGVPRESLAKIVTQREAKAIDADHFDPFALYKYVSGLNPVRLRRLMQAVGLRREAMPGRSQAAQVYRELRRQTVSEDVELPNVDLERDIGGYPEVKLRLREELLDLLRRKDSLGSESEIQALEGLLPRGIIFHGPPGTGKTYFAKAMATAMDATVIIVSGPELKSKWVGESEENLRRVFRQARRSAPAVVVFDEIDAFAHARGTYEGSGVEHSMVNQLLTEMDGFRGSESVFVVGTTNFLESLDGALLRPGRFEFLIEIPAPGVQDRREIVEIYDRKLELGLSRELQEHLVRRTEGLAERARGLPFTGDHIYAVCRALKRQAIRTGEKNFTPEDIDRALQRKTRAAVVLSPAEERVVAFHEAGHALLAMLVEHATPPERISIAADMEGALGYVLRAARAKPYAITAADMRADICVGLGGMCAERLVFGEVSIGAHTDLQQVNRIARAMVEEYGMGASTGVLVRLDDAPRHGTPMSERRRERVDAEVTEILEKELARAQALLSGHRAMLEALAETLLSRKVLDRAELSALTKGESDG
ncbi:cell division protease FtsH [Nannocystis exedens]|uniref:Cell division protease FtsH n=1 Tax=Nannocystis exedens TaxID=54 RepID=A0A1I1Y706_9BACT|nr:AAA family ATPase [Nannocystis exedens]PCC71843.1 ATP-dependent zinc metalloprotease FtsH 4 [Nannocystis exedens]SFE15092.1 cell division protease FtsH [Nannocystis exedens]